MEIKLIRKYKKSDYTIGKLYVNGEYFCDTLEDKDRGLDSKMSLADLRRMKLSGTTAIPTGRYHITMKVFSAKFGARPYYQNVCKGLLPRLLNVPAYEGVLMHCGNTHHDTEGCILVGQNRAVGMVMESQKTFERLYALMKHADERGEDIEITITDKEQ